MAHGLRLRSPREWLAGVASALVVALRPVVWPQPAGASALTVDIPGLGEGLPVIQRSRRSEGRTDFVGSEQKHRYVIERIAGVEKIRPPADPIVEALRSPTRGGILAYLTDDRPLAADKKSRVGQLTDPGALVLLLSIASPVKSVPAGKSGVLQWTVLRGGHSGVAAVPIAQSA